MEIAAGTHEPISRTRRSFDFGDAVARTWKAGDKESLRQQRTGIVTKSCAKSGLDPATSCPSPKANCPGAFKMTLPAPRNFPRFPSSAASRTLFTKITLNSCGPSSNHEERNLAKLANDGVSYIQIDAPRYSYYMDPKWPRMIRTEIGTDPDAALDEAIRADNACFRAARRPASTLGIIFAVAIIAATGTPKAANDAIAEKNVLHSRCRPLSSRIRRRRSGTFEPLRFIPKGKTVVLASSAQSPK